MPRRGLNLHGFPRHHIDLCDTSNLICHTSFDFLFFFTPTSTIRFQIWAFTRTQNALYFSGYSMKALWQFCVKTKLYLVFAISVESQFYFICTSSVMICDLYVCLLIIVCNMMGLREILSSVCPWTFKIDGSGNILMRMVVVEINCNLINIHLMLNFQWESVIGYFFFVVPSCLSME